jgi:hypothetical protein
MTKNNSTKRERERQQLNQLMAKLGVSVDRNKIPRPIRTQIDTIKNNVVRKGKAALTKKLTPMQNYARQLITPWIRNKPVQGVPYPPATPSFKARGFLTVNGAIGTRGVGFVALRGTTVSDSVCLWYTDPLFTGTTFDTTNTVPGLDTAVCGNLPYAQANIGDGLSTRLIACGGKITYTGTTLNRGGTYYTYTDPEGEEIAYVGSTKDVSYLTSRRGCRMASVGAKSEVCYLNPITNSDLEYSENATKWPNGVAGCTTIIAVVGTAGNAFRFDICIDVEYIGSTIEGTSTINPPTGPPNHVITAVGNSHSKHASSGIGAAIESVAAAVGVQSAIGKVWGGEAAGGGGDVEAIGTLEDIGEASALFL